MGGYGSGRYTGMPAVEDGFTLDLNRLIRQKNILPGSHVSGTLTWTNTRSGKEVGSIGYEAAMRPREPNWLRLHYTAKSKPMDYNVTLINTPCNYGGVRWWFLCPLTWRRASKLYLPPGATSFACRKAYRLPYRSQRESGIDRTHSRQARLFKKLGAKYDYYEGSIPARPKGMHRQTYNWLAAELEAAIDAHELTFAIGARRILGLDGLP